MRSAPRRTQLHTLRDFTGGLNLVADTFRLADNESPDLLNVDIDRRGGFQVRRGVYPFSESTLPAAPNTIWSYNDNGTVYTTVQTGSSVYYGSGSTWKAVTRVASGVPVSDLGRSDGVDVCAVTFNNISYWVRGNRTVIKWDGSLNGDGTGAATALGTAFNNTTVPTSGNIPSADHMAVHSGYLWVAGTWESGTHYPNRVRWSWANTFDNSGENWRTEDYIDIDDGKDSDSITAIIPYGDQLIVFKRDSVYAVYGYSADSFSVVNVSNTVGAVSHSAAIATPAGLFFFDHQTGLNVFSGGQVKQMFDQIWPALRDGSIPSSLVDNIDLGWIEGRLWMSVPWADIPAAPRGMTFVLDPRLNGGVWTKYSLQAGPFARGHRSEEYLGYLNGTNRIYRFDVQDQYYDYLNAVAGPSVIDAYYRTKWIDLGEPAIKKRWRRAEAVMQTDQAYEIPVVVYANYDPTVTVKNFKFISQDSLSAGGNSVWGDADSINEPPEGIWGTSVWSIDGTHGYVDRGANLGVSRAVSLKLGGKVLTIAETGVSQAPAFWGIDALIIKYVPRRVR